MHLIMCSSKMKLLIKMTFTVLFPQKITARITGIYRNYNHFYDTGYTLTGAYKEILKHWKALYQISMYNKQQGIQPWSRKKGKQFLRDAQNRITDMKRIDALIG